MLLSSLAEAARKAATFAPPASWDGCLASLSAALNAICVQVRDRKNNCIVLEHYKNTKEH